MERSSLVSTATDQHVRRPQYFTTRVCDATWWSASAKTGTHSLASRWVACHVAARPITTYDDGKCIRTAGDDAASLATYDAVAAYDAASSTALDGGKCIRTASDDAASLATYDAASSTALVITALNDG